MSIKFSKVVPSLPATLEPDTIYFVRTSSGFRIYCSDAQGNIAHSAPYGNQKYLYVCNKVPWHIK